MGKLSSQSPQNPLKGEELRLIDAWWRACNYLSVGMIYLKDNALLKEPLKSEDVKHRLLGHWGASPALSFVWARPIHLAPPIQIWRMALEYTPGGCEGSA
jgi:phosphoketolase